MKPIDPWVCRIPRELLAGLAADVRLRGRDRVLMALLAKLYERFERDQGITDASLGYLKKATGLDVSTVRDVLRQLRTSGVLVDVKAPSGLRKTLRLVPHGVPHSPMGERDEHPGAESPTPPWGNGTNPTVWNGAKTSDEGRPEEISEEARVRADDEQARRRNGGYANGPPEPVGPILERSELVGRFNELAAKRAAGVQ